MKFNQVLEIAVASSFTREFNIKKEIIVMLYALAKQSGHYDKSKIPIEQWDKAFFENITKAKDEFKLYSVARVFKLVPSHVTFEDFTATMDQKIKELLSDEDTGPATEPGSPIE